MTVSATTVINDDVVYHLLHVHGEKGYGGHALGSRGHFGGLGHPCRGAGVAGGSTAGRLRRHLHQQRCDTGGATGDEVVDALARPAEAAAILGGGKNRSTPFVSKQ